MATAGNHKIEITDGEIYDALAEAGYTVPEDCPKCGYHHWDNGFDDPGMVMGVFYEQDIKQLASAGTYQLRCRNCGYIEVFSFAPVLKRLGKI